MLMKYCDYSDVQAIDHLKLKRRQINPKLAFRGILQAINNQMAAERKMKALSIHPKLALKKNKE